MEYSNINLTKEILKYCIPDTNLPFEGFELKLNLQDKDKIEQYILNTAESCQLYQNNANCVGDIIDIEVICPEILDDGTVVKELIKEKLEKYKIEKEIENSILKELKDTENTRKNNYKQLILNKIKDNDFAFFGKGEENKKEFTNVVVDIMIQHEKKRKKVFTENELMEIIGFITRKINLYESLSSGLSDMIDAHVSFKEQYMIITDIIEFIKKI